MGWWFGRKSAPADARPFVPGWLSTTAEAVEGFVAPFDGLRAFVTSTAEWALFRKGAWEIGAIRGSAVLIDGDRVLASRAGPIAVPDGGEVVDAEARDALSAIIGTLRHHGLIAT